MNWGGGKLKEVTNTTFFTKMYQKIHILFIKQILTSK